MLLDFSVAFDTVDHDLFLQRLETDLGFGRTVLQWFLSYMENQTHAVQIGNIMSDTHHDKQGVPQGSVMGPITLTMYISPIDDIMKEHGMNAMFYADDTQIYLMFKYTEHEETLNRLNTCIADVKAWAAKNTLSLNDAKTEVIHFTSKSCPEPPLPNNTTGESHIYVLNPIVDQHITIKDQIQNLCKSAMAAIRCISIIYNQTFPVKPSSTHPSLFIHHQSN